MSWTLNASGHVASREEEEELVEAMAEFVSEQGEAVSTANVSTTHLGSVDLVARANTPEEVEPDE